MIDQAGLSELLTGMIPADVFMMILRFHRGFDSGFSSNASFETVLENFSVSGEGSNAVLCGGESPVFCAPYFPVYFSDKVGFGRCPGNSFWDE
jgi:hypothetical protein